MAEEFFLISTGRLLITLLEVTDALPNQDKNKSIARSWLKRPVREQHYIFGELQLFADHSTEPGFTIQTATIPLVSSEKVTFGEEFLLENVKSSSKLKLILYEVNVVKGKSNELQCIGEALIPISRLEENSTIIQWYQLTNPISKEGVRTAVKMKFVFNTETPNSKNNNGTSKRESLLNFMKGLDTQLTVDTLELHNNPQSDTALTSDGTNEINDPNTSEQRPSLEYSKVEGLQVAESNYRSRRRSMISQDPPTPAAKFPSATSNTNSSTTSSPLLNAELEHGLDVGLIDYALVLGPCTSLLSQPTHRMKEELNQFERIENDPHRPGFIDALSPNTDQNSPIAAAAPSVSSGLFSASSFKYLVNSEMKIWDRIPVRDLDDMELPSKIEWFACPEGSITVANGSRPPHFLRSFVLNAGGDTGEIYGLSLNVFIKTYQPDPNDLTQQKLSHQNDQKQFFLSSDSEDSSVFSLPRHGKHDETTVRNPSVILESVEEDERDEIRNESAIANPSKQNSKSHSSVSQANVSASALLPVWTMCTICFLNRIPYVDELSKCLQFAYEAVIEPELVRWEAEKELKKQNHDSKSAGEEEKFSSLLKDQVSAVLETSSAAVSQFPFSTRENDDQEKDEENKNEENIGDVTANQTTELEKDKLERLPTALSFLGSLPDSASVYSFPFPSCKLLLEKLISFLFLECPKPIPKLLSLTVQLKHLSTENRSNKEELRSEQIRFIAQNPEFLPNPSSSLRYSYILQCFGPRVMLDILTCVLSESRMIFYSRDLSKLSIILEGFRQLIYPFVWTHVYLPIVPVQLLNLVEAPVPFLLGTHSENLYYMNLHNLNEILLIDCDNGMIMENSNSIATTDLLTSTVKFPEKEDRWLMLSLKEIHRSLGGSNSTPPPPPSNSSCSTSALPWKEVECIDRMIQLLIFDVLVRFLRYIPDCLFYLSSSCPVFNRPLFMMEYIQEEYKKTLEHLSITNAFHVLTENVYANSKRFFLFTIKKLEEAAVAEEEKEENDQVTNDNSDDENDDPDVIAVNTSYESDLAIDVRSPNLLKSPGSSLSSSLSMMRGDDTSLRKNLSILVGYDASVPSPPPSATQESYLRDVIEPMNIQSVSYESMSSAASKAEAESSNTKGSTFSRPNTVKFTQPSSLIRKLSQNSVFHDMNSANNTPTTPAQSGSGGGFLTNSLTRHSSATKMGFNLKAAKSFIRMENSPIFRKQLATPSGNVHTPFFISPFAGLLPEWVIDGTDLTAEGKNETSSDYLIYLIEQRMKFYKNLIIEYFSSDGMEIKDILPMFASASSSVFPCKYHIKLVCEVTATEKLPIYYSTKADDQEHPAKLNSEVNEEKLENTETAEKLSTNDAAEGILASNEIDTSNKPELVIVNPEQELLLFDHVLVAKAEGSATHWTVTSMSSSFSFPIEQLVNDLRKCPYSLLFLDSGSIERSNTGPFQSSREPLANRQSLLASTTKAAEMSLSIAHSSISATLESIRPADDIVVEFLQLLLTMQDIDEEVVAQSMQRCTIAFDQQYNRSGFIQMLKNAKQKAPTAPRQEQGINQQPDQNIYPLHSIAFESIAKLFLTILTICNHQNDYINAFRLLEIGGHYFQIITLNAAKKKELLGNKDQEKKENAEEGKDEYELQTVEFLSERICHHPIYQLSSMWKGLLLDRLPVESVKSSSQDHNQEDLRGLSPNIKNNEQLNSQNLSTPVTNTPPARKKYHINVIMAEIRSLLYMMLDLGVNSSRALNFIQSITAEYQLNINEYIKLQRFMMDLWSQHYPSFHHEHLPYPVGAFPPSEPEIASNNNPISASNETPLGCASSGSQNLYPRSKKPSSKDRRDSSAGISELMMKHGHHIHHNHHPSSVHHHRSFSKSMESLYSESSELNYRNHQQQHQRSASLDIAAPNPSSQNVFSISTSFSVSHDPSHSPLGKLPPSRYVPPSINNPNRFDSFFEKSGVRETIEEEGTVSSTSPVTKLQSRSSGGPSSPPQLLLGSPPKPPSKITGDRLTGDDRSTSKSSSRDEFAQPYSPITPGTVATLNEFSERNRSGSVQSESNSSTSFSYRNRSTSQAEDRRPSSATPINETIISKLVANASFDEYHKQKDSDSITNGIGMLAVEEEEEVDQEVDQKHLCDLTLGYYPVAVKGLEQEKNINTMTSIGNWLLLGNDEHIINVVDLRNFQLTTKLKHANTNLLSSPATTATTANPSPPSVANAKGPVSTASVMQGVTVMNALEDTFYYDNYDNNYTHNFVVFSGCAQGLVKVWHLPNCTYHYHQQNRHSGDRRDILIEDEADEEEKEELERQKALILASVSKFELDADEEAASEERDDKKSSGLSSFFGGGKGTKRNSKTGLFWMKGSDTTTTPAPISSPSKTPATSTNAALASNTTNVRIKQSSVLTMKTHNSMITSLVSQAHPDHLSGWIIASGDCRGDLTIVKSNDGNTIHSTIGMNIKTAPISAQSTTGQSSGQLNSSSLASNSKINPIKLSPASNPNSINDYTISSLAFFHTNASYANSSFTLPSYLIVGNYSGIINIMDIQYGMSVYQSQGHLLKINKILPLSKNNPYQFLTCSNDRNILVWDIRMRYATNMTAGVAGSIAGGGAKVIDPLHPFTVEERCLGYSIMNGGGTGTSASSLFSPFDQVSVTSNITFSSHPHQQNLPSQMHQQLSSHYSSASNGSIGFHPFFSYKKSSSGPVTDMAVGGFDSSIVVSTSADGIIKLWDMRHNLNTPYHSIINGHSPSRISSLIWEGDRSSAAAHSPSSMSSGQAGQRDASGSFFYTAGYDGVVRSWDVISGGQSQSLNVNLQRIQPPASSTTMVLQALTSLHGWTPSSTPMVETEKIVQMIKPSFFYENFQTPNPANSTTTASTSAAVGGEEAKTTSSTTTKRCYRNCLVTRNWYGGIQLFANNSMHYRDKFGRGSSNSRGGSRLGSAGQGRGNSSGPLVGQLMPESSHHADSSQYHIFV